jgi:sugar O-acyltransferase (sialic acid O-acetyltransferase NeuD family)
VTRGRPLLIIGAGGLGREVLETVRSTVADGFPWSIVGFLDDHPSRHGSMVGGVPVLGSSDEVHDHADAAVIVCIASSHTPDSRALLITRLALDPLRFATVVHPSVLMPGSCSLAEGSILLANTVLTTDVHIGRHVVVMPHSTLTHDVQIEDYATLASGVRLGGSVTVGEAAYLGAGSLVRENLSIGARSIIGMGAVVTKPVPAGQTWCGVPAIPSLPDLPLVDLPLVDLAAAHEESATAIDEGIRRVISHGAFVGGPEVRSFEREFADFSGVPHCVGVANGTDALEIALRARGIGVGDEVIVPAFTFAATAEAVLRAGASVVFADVTEDGLLDPESVVALIGPQTAAIVPVHLYGQMADLSLLSTVADRFGVLMIEDAAQAHGAQQGNVRPGAVNPAAVSFYPGKNLGAYGDAGAILTADSTFADRCRRIANHGGSSRYSHDEVGFNSRLDSIQAAVLLARLPSLARDNARRRHAAERYALLLSDLPDVVRPQVWEGNEHTWHLYVVHVDDRDGVRARMASQGISAGVHYPLPLHHQPAFASAHKGDLPTAERLARTCLSLPLYPQMSADQQQRVVDSLRESLA